jgi:ribonuclease HIII
VTAGGLRREGELLPRVCLSQYGEALAFGPLVVCAVLLDARSAAALADLSRTGWPGMAPDLLRRTARRVSLVVPYDHVELAPRKYNTLVAKMSSNRNRVLNWAYKKALEGMLTRYPEAAACAFDLHAPAFAVLAQDIPRGDSVSLVYRGLDEEDPGLAAAGVLARAHYEKGLAQVARKIGHELPGPEVAPDDALARVHAAGGMPLVLQVAKRDDPRVERVIAGPAPSG